MLQKERYKVMTYTQLDKMLYQAMKAAAKMRKIKLSAEQVLYKKVDPYFFDVFYHIGEITEGKIDVTLDISVKYHRFDELQYSIINPSKPVRFTDKIRANSGAMCNAGFPRMVQSFYFNGNEEAIPQLCEDILNFLEKYYSDFLAMTEKEYGSLGDYYIANRDTMPRLAGLAYLDKGDFQGAAESFLHPNMDGKSSIWSVYIHTDEQRRRSQESGTQIFHTSYGESIDRSRKEQFADYAIALQNGLEWTNDRAMYGLLLEERGL